MTQAGPAIPVIAVTDRSADAGPALRVAVVSDGRPTEAGPARPVIVVNDGRPTQGNVPVPIVVATGVQAGRVLAGPAIPVVVVSGSLNPTPSITPTSLTGLVMYYTAASLGAIADNATFTPWPDSSGLGNDATQPTANNRPTKRATMINGRPAVRFASLPQEMVIPATVSVGTRAFSLFIIGRKLTNPAQEVYIRLGTGLQFAFQQISGPLAMSAGGASVISTLNPTSNPHFMGVVGDASDSRFYLDAAVTTQAAFVSATTAAVTGLLASFASSFRLYGDIAEIMLYNRALSAAEVLGLRDYAHANYAVLTPRTKQVVFDGDSLTRGTAGPAQLGTASSYPELTVAALADSSSWSWTNFGTNGTTIVTANADAAAQIDPFYNASYAKNICVVELGSNDMYFGATAATVYNNLKTYWAARRAVGWLVIAATITPRSDAGVAAGFEAERQTLLALIRGDSSLYDGLIDFAANTTIGDAGDELNTTNYTTDRAHLLTAGYVIEASIAAPVIAAL